MLIKNSNRPLNESEIHYELKQIGKYVISQKAYQIIGEEIPVGWSTYLLSYRENFNTECSKKNVIDVIGLKTRGLFRIYGNEPKHAVEPTFRSMGIEAKASLSDFKNGFCCRADRTYIIAPLGIIPHKLIPKEIGLIEVDLDNYEVKSDYYKKFVFKGITETIKPKTRLDREFKGESRPEDNKRYQYWCKDILRLIAYKQTKIDINKNNQIYIGGKNWSGNIQPEEEDVN